MHVGVYGWLRRLLIVRIESIEEDDGECEIEEEQIKCKYKFRSDSKPKGC